MAIKERSMNSCSVNLQAQLQAELEEKRLARQKEEEANIALIESWDNTQAMMDADRKKHFAALRAQEKRNKPPSKAQKKSKMSTYLKHMAGYKQSQLKIKSFAEIQKLFDKAMTRSSSKRVGGELEQEKAKKKKIDDDKEAARLKELMEVISYEEGVAIDAIPLSTKPSSIVDYKIIKE
ncbi:hypothetical protein Tco_1026870 [Tanacetum coccineum]